MSRSARIPAFAAALLPMPLETLLAYDREKAVQRDVTVDAEKTLKVVNDEEIKLELDKLSHARRFVWDRLRMTDTFSDKKLFGTEE